MRAQTITTMTRQRRTARRHRTLALALGVCALAVPAAASAAPIDGYSSVNSITGSSNDSSEPIDGWNYELLNSPAGQSGQPAADRDDSLYAHPITPNALLGADGLGEPTLVTGSPASADDGFDWASGAVGAAAVMALVALGGAALLAFRRRTTVSPAA